MNLTDCKNLLNSMKVLTDLTTNLEYSNQNTLTQDRKDLHRNLILPLMNKEYEGMKEELNNLEKYLIENFKDPYNVDLDKYFEDN